MKRYFDHRNRSFFLNDDGEQIFATVHTLQGELVEMFRFKPGHMAITNNWPDEKIADYLSDILDARQGKEHPSPPRTKG